MSATPSRLRNRIMVAMIGVSIGVLVFTGLATVVLARRARVDAARSELTQRAPEVATALNDLRTRLRNQQAQTARPAVDRRLQRQFALLLRATLNISNATLVTITPAGGVESGLSAIAPGTPLNNADRPLLDLPAGISAGDLNPAQLRSGSTQSGTDGTTVFTAVPLEADASGNVPVVVLTNRVEQGLGGRAGPFFFFTALFALGAAAFVSYLVARRFTRPLATMGATAGRIAAGDLSARVDLGSHPADELSELAGTLNRMAEQLDSARGQERAFLLSVSHDLRTPLTSIRGYAEAMTDGTADDPDIRRRAAAVIAAESRRLERLVADLLQLARLDAHEFSLRTRPVDAVGVVRDALDAFRPGAEELGVELRLDAPATLPADADPERLGQIVANLVENALKYADASIVVQVVTDPGSGRELQVLVHDDGPGIDPAELNAVFARLYTARGTPGRTVGTGLGLAIVRELAAAMGGTASAQSSPGGGATFIVRLPVLPAGDATRSPE